MGVLQFKKFSGNTKAIPLTLAVFVVVLAATAGSAWSFESHTGGAVQEMGAPQINISKENKTSSAMADKCLPLLQSIRQTTSISAMDRNQRAAGKAAALGLIFGVRFALSPSPNTKAAKPQLDVWQPSFNSAGSQRALAIADYRACLKNEALKAPMDALDGFRWVR